MGSICGGAEPEPELEFMLKMVIVGDSGSGKTSLLESYIAKESKLAEGSSVRKEFYAVQNINDRMIGVTLCDASSSAVKQAREALYEDADLFGICVAADSSLDTVQKWVEEIREKQPDKMLCLFLTKMDLNKEKEA